MLSDIPAPKLERFVMESNSIEGIQRMPMPIEIHAHDNLLFAPELTIPTIAQLAWACTTCSGREGLLRDKIGRDVFVKSRDGVHAMSPGGPEIPKALDKLLVSINRDVLDPFEAHVEFENLHPFCDGNGRTGRAIWLWQHYHRQGIAPQLGFLHCFYYETLATVKRKGNEYV